MILHINSPIGPETVQMLVDAYNKLEFISPTEQEHLEILFASEGGDCSSTVAMLHLINSNKEITSITAYSHLLSNGFRLFFGARCKKTLLPDTQAMYHLTRNSGHTIYEGGVTHNAESEEYLRKRMLNYSYLKETDYFVKFTPEELAKIKKNYDLWISDKRLLQMFKYNKALLGL